MAKTKDFESVLEEAGGALERVEKEAAKVMKSRAKGDNWCVKAVPPLVSLATLRKHVEGARKAACKPLKDKVKLIEAPARKVLNMVEIVDTELRERVMREHKGGGKVSLDEVGDLMFSEKWGFEVTDIEAVDPELLTVDKAQVMELIKGGMQNIPGIEVKKLYTLSVCKPGALDYAMNKGLK